MITVFADQHLYKIREIVPSGVNLNLYDPEQGLPDNINQADALLVRTVTPINKETLNPIPKNLEFIGTGSAGTDHIDKSFLKEHGISFSSAAGCNARSVAEYVATALLLWSEKKGTDLDTETVGIVGVGHVGSALKKLLDKLEWSYVLYDPPRELRDSGFRSAPLSELLDCSILTFHTPLTFKSRYPTYHWLNREKLEGHQYKMVINTCRGGVVHEEDLLRAMESGFVDDIIIDVWENEPVFNDKLARKAFIATPHIAGYSIQSKIRGTEMIVRDMASHFSIDIPSHSFNDIERKSISDSSSGQSLSDILMKIHPLGRYHRELQKLIGMEDHLKEKKFNHLRTSIPYRDEYTHLQLEESIFRIYPILYEFIYL